MQRVRSRVGRVGRRSKMLAMRLRVLTTPVQWIEDCPFYVLGPGILEQPPDEFESRLLRRMHERGLLEGREISA